MKPGLPPKIPSPPVDAAGPEAVAGPHRARRGGVLLNLDRQLRDSPPRARGWNHLIGALCTQLALPAVLLALGGSAAQAEALRDAATACDQDDLFEPAQRAALRLALEMTRELQVADSTFLAGRSALGDDRQVVELVATIAFCNRVSRVIVAPGIAREQRGCRAC